MFLNKHFFFFQDVDPDGESAEEDSSVSTHFLDNLPIMIRCKCEKIPMNVFKNSDSWEKCTTNT